MGEAAQNIPLLSPRAFGEYSAQEFRDYVTSLYIEPPKPPVPAEYTITQSKKGVVSVRITRTPKFLLTSEIPLIAAHLNWSQQDTHNFLTQKRKIKIIWPLRPAKMKGGKSRGN